MSDYKTASHHPIHYHKIKAVLPQLDAKLTTACTQLNIELGKHQREQLLGFLDGLLLWSGAYNLTAITKPEEAMVKHMIDCLAVLPYFGRLFPNTINRVLDIGTGAGLPAVVLAIVRPDWQVSAVDSNNKKIRFIRQMASELGLSNIHPIASRIEQLQNHHDGYDVVTSRAFASLSDFVAVASPHLAPQGVLSAMKGKSPTEDELSHLSDWQTCVDLLDVPFLPEERCLVQLSRHQ